MASKCSSILAVALWMAVSASRLGAQPAPGAEAGTAVDAEAAAVAQQGIDLFKQGRYAEAAALFDRSFRMTPVAVVAWNLARCHEELEHPDEAIASFERFRDLSTDDEQKRTADGKIERLLQRFYATLSVTTEPAGAQVLVDGKPVGVAPLTNVRVRSGLHEIELRLARHETQKRDVRVAPGKPFPFTSVLTALPPTVILDAPEPVGGLVILVDGVRQPQVAAPARLEVTEGGHTVEVRAGPDWAPLRQTVRVAGGEQATLTLVRASSVGLASATGSVAPTAPAAAREPVVRVIEDRVVRNYSTLATVILGVGVAAAATGGVLHILGYTSWKDVTGAKKDAFGHVSGVSRADAIGIADGARLKYAAAYGLYGAGAAAIGTAVVLYALSASDQSSASLAPVPLPGGAGLSLSGRF